MNHPHMTRRGISITTTLAFGVLTSAGLCGGEVFESLNVDLRSQIPLNGFASNPSNASDCWVKQVLCFVSLLEDDKLESVGS